MSFLIDFILHIDHHIEGLVQSCGVWTYVILFAIIFVETGAIILPFLPGDSLLFAAGAVAAAQPAILNPWIFGVLFVVAAVTGDSLNFFVARTAGNKLRHQRWFSKVVRPKHLQEAEVFFAKHGAAAIILARFLPIVRTFVPFVAGISQFDYRRFLQNSVIAAIIWSVIGVGAGYLFGNLAFVKTHFSAIIIGVVLVTLLPTVFAFGRSLLAKKKQA